MEKYQHPMQTFCNQRKINLKHLFKDSISSCRSEFFCPELDIDNQAPRDVFQKYEAFNSRISKSGDENETEERSVAKVDDIEIDQRDFQGLKGPNYINDNVINAFGILLQRKLDSDKKCSKVLDTYFYAQLVSKRGYDYENVANHYADVDMFGLDKIVIPIFVSGCHWGLIVVCLDEKKMYYFDSLRFDGMFVMMNVLKWLFERHISYHRGVIDVSKWQLYNSAVGNSSPQKNGYDCGVFLMMYMDCICHNTVLDWIKEEKALMIKYRNYVVRCLLANKLCK